MEREFRATRVCARACVAWARDLPLLMGLALVVHLPLLAHDLFQRLAAPTPAAVDPPPENDWWAFARWMMPHFADGMGNRLLYELFARLTAAMVIFAVYERILKRQPSFRSCLRGGWRRRGPVLAAALLLFLIELPVLAFLNLTVFYMAFQNVLTPWFWELLILGTLVFLGVMVPFWVAVPAAVVERSGRWLRRSWSLTKDRRIRILAITATMFALEFGGEHLVDRFMGTLGPWGHVTANWVVSLAVTSLSAVLAVIGYRSLRIEKEGVDVVRLEEVFG